MRSEITKSVHALLAIFAALLVGVPAVGQDNPSGAAALYEREVFSYERAGRVDPFRSLLDDAELGIRFEDLSLRGIVHHTEAGRSVAVLARAGSERRIQARVGDRFGSVRIAAIHPDRVDLVIEELGVVRRETLHIQKTPTGENGR